MHISFNKVLLAAEQLFSLFSTITGDAESEQSVHVLGWLEILGEYEGRELGLLEGSKDKREDGNVEGMLVGFMDGSLDGTEDSIFASPVIRDRLGKEDGSELATVTGMIEGNKDGKTEGPKLGGIEILGDIDMTALGYSLPSQQLSPG